jgi:hypothetical protein
MTKMLFSSMIGVSMACLFRLLLHSYVVLCVQGLQNDRWIRDITGALDMVSLDQYVRL